MSKFLINEPPLQVLPSLAKEIGLNEAIVLQQVHYWLNHAKVEHEGKMWIYKSYDKWREQDFPFWSIDTIKRTVSSLRKQDLLLVEALSSNSFNRVNHYTINYTQLANINQKDAAKPSATDSSKMQQSTVATCTDHSGNLQQSDSSKMQLWGVAECNDVKETNKESKKETNKDIGKKPHSIPDDFKPTDKQIEKMKTYGINADLLLDSFINGSKANGKKYKCWNSAFSTWINNEIKWSNLKPVEQQPTHPSYKPFEQEKSSLSIEEQRQALLSVMGGDI